MLDLETARRLAREVVEAKGADFVYKYGSHCFYVPITVVQGWIADAPEDSNFRYKSEFSELRSSDYNPDEDPRRDTPCLVGAILDAAGETRHHDPSNVNEGAFQLTDKYPDMMDDEAADYLSRMQGMQDDGASWGRALQVAEDVLEQRLAEDRAYAESK